ncbi:MAG: DNA polymerase III subunit delta' [Nitrospinaceae bacterium]|nr:DNA polymerase III subunit delta' [Nitrospinaceae bacterium]NIR55416.1 DNA polymerase III subunit delta' [Nitrospinaceae bacterium]NIS85856.1 DNA polymerase III subunit delta' [Nitrospinaceae bacterium]NIT82700.1 DNA polymerase III subunit delta' [Nitrospinaceae bacterium]NIU44909.1 DNA polymerase III subunit delta' [Nitrospinaceae bacterium]
MAFECILGQEQPVQIIRKSLQNRSLSHAYLFYGPDSIGKKLAAIELAKALNCDTRGPENSCDRCSSCRKIEERTHPDFFLLEPEKSSPSAREGWIKIDRVRDLQKKLMFLPYQGTTKVAVIDSCEQMNPQAANTFLKTLEEPPGHTVLVLVSANPFQLLPTLVSRCQGIQFHPLAPEVVTRILEKVGPDLPLEKRQFLAQRCGGRIDRALDESGAHSAECRDELVDLLGTLSFDRMDAVFRWCRTWSRRPEELQNLLEELLHLVRDLAVMKTGSSSPKVLHNRDLRERLTPLAARTSLPALLHMFDAAYQTKFALTGNANAQLSLETMLIRCCEAA